MFSVSPARVRQGSSTSLIRRKGMTARFRSVVLAIFLLSATLISPSAQASGSGLLMSDDSLTVVGDGDVGMGDINVSIIVTSHDLHSNGFLDMSLTDSGGTPLAAENNSVNLLNGESETVWFNISNVPIGQHILTMQLWGDVGQSFESNVSYLQVYVRKLSPASIHLESSNEWDLIPVNGSTGLESGNSSIRDGDLVWIRAGLSNNGDVAWDGNATMSGQELNMTVEGQSTAIANFTIGPLSEGLSTATIELLEGLLIVDSDTVSISTGPPPLPRILLDLFTPSTEVQLSEQVNWSVNVSNTGETEWSGSVVCTFPESVELLNQSYIVQHGQNVSNIITFDVRPGTLSCNIVSSLRIHDDSVTESNHTYDMAAGHLMRAGSEGLTVQGGPFHVGDPVPLAILIHNAGDFSGIGTLESREGSQNGGDIGPWAILDTRTFEVGSSLELGADHMPLVAGDRRIEWRVSSSDSLIASDLSGHLNLSILPSQELGISISTVSWTLSAGLDIEITTSLSNGESRSVLLEVGTEGSIGEVLQISNEIELSPGHRTIEFNLGQPDAASIAWARVSAIGWSADGTGSAETPLIRPDPQTRVEFVSLSTTDPAEGDSVSIKYSLINEGGGSTLAGSMSLIDMRTQELLWTGESPIVSSGNTHEGTILLTSWPAGAVVDMKMEWHTPHTDSEGTGSWLSEDSSSEKEDSEIGWMSLIYGAIIGLTLGLITRTIMRAQAGEPILTRRQRGTRQNKKKEV